MNSNLMFSSKDQTWETPIDFFNKVNEEFNFDIDVCATEATAKCDMYYTPEIDGLKQEWRGDLLDESPLWKRNKKVDRKSV